MLKYIENLRHKPKAVQNRHAFLWASAFTLMVAAIWFTGYRAQVIAELQQNKEQSTAAASNVFADLQASIKLHDPVPHTSSTASANSAQFNIDSILQARHVSATSTSDGYGQGVQIEATGTEFGASSSVIMPGQVIMVGPPATTTNVLQ